MVNNLADCAPGILEVILSKLESLPRDTTIVDVGCGKGHLIRLMRDAGFTEIFGIDKFNGPYIDAMIDLSQEAEFFDRTLKRINSNVVIISEVLEHLENPLQILRIALQNSKMVVISFPNAFSRWSLLQRVYTGQSRWFEDDSTLSPEVAKAHKEQGPHISVLDPVCIAKFAKSIDKNIQIETIGNSNRQKHETNWIQNKGMTYYEELTALQKRLVIHHNSDIDLRTESELGNETQWYDIVIMTFKDGRQNV